MNGSFYICTFCCVCIYIHIHTYSFNNWSAILLKSLSNSSKFWVDALGFSIYIVVVQSLSCVQLFVIPWTAARQGSLSITNSQSLLKLMSIESMMPSNHLILCHLLLLLPSTFPSIRVFSKQLALCIRWPKYWSFSFSISPSKNIQDWSPLGWTDLL